MLREAVLAPVFDHAVIDARDELERAARVYGRLGFNLSERGHHTLGSSNHLAVFGTNYLELLGWEKGAPARPDLDGFPIGLGGFVFRVGDAEAACMRLREAGLLAESPIAFSRPVRQPSGKEEDAKFRAVRFPRETLAGSRTYLCEHLTPQLVWREGNAAHANGALDVTRLVMAAAKPSRVAGLMRTMFGADAVVANESAYTLGAGSTVIEIVEPAALGQLFQGAEPDLRGRDEVLAAITLRTRSLRMTADALRDGDVDARVSTKRILVPAAEALNVTLEFVE